MSVEVAEEAGQAQSGVEDLRLAGGLVRLSRVDQPASSTAPAGPVPAEPLPVEPPPVDPLLPTEPPPAEPPPTEPPGVQWYAHLEDEPTQAVPLLEGGPPEEQPAEEQPLVEEPVEDDVDPYYDDPPIWVPRPPAPPFGPPVLPPEPEVPGATTGPVARLVFSSGETVEVDRAVLVGRAPEAARSASGEESRLVTVASPHQEISSTHLEIRPGTGADHGTAVITDLGSTNGTVLVQPGLPPEDLQPASPCSWSRAPWWTSATGCRSRSRHRDRPGLPASTLRARSRRPS
ncbi:FHA domain-containing protein [Nocardioides ungokensis]|uniref:FHA domain-containing protein n=1 Tax=Nocardioides ungokensis TaxID=1643322 RepID=UPI0015DEC164|nr:FHA domain-containing protein [Nocardioides ungokensis]